MDDIKGSIVINLSKATLEACIHCGLCLPACPTYLATGRETESPRGRIYLVDQYVSEKLPFSDRMAEHLNSCLGCLGCQTACPSGVNYEAILDAVRPQLAYKRSAFSRLLGRIAFRQVLPRYGLLRVLGMFLRIWQLAVGSRVLGRLPDFFPPNTPLPPPRRFLKRLAGWEKFLPILKEHIPLPTRLDPKNPSDRGVHTLLFKGCVMDIFYNHVNHSTMRILLKQGHSVEVPDQTCCGALAFHQGEEDIARDLARRNLERFGFGQDPIIVNAAGCGAMLKHYKTLFEDDPELAHRAAEVSARVRDLSEFLVQYPFQAPPQPFERKTTYHAACHLAHAQKVHEEPLTLLQELDEKNEPRKMVPLAQQEHCCGSAGIYNLFNTELSLDILDEKLDHLENTGAKTVVTSNPGCQLQLEAGIAARGLDIEVRHIAEVLDQAY